MKKRIVAVAATAAVMLGMSLTAPASASTQPEAGATAVTAVTAGRDSHIAYSRDGKIYVAYADLTSPRQVATYDASVFDLDELKISANGRVIAFSLTAWGASPQMRQIVVRDIVANKVLRTIKSSLSSNDFLRDISPDGTKLLRNFSGSDYLTSVGTGASTKLALGAGQKAMGFTADGLRLILEKNASNVFAITRYNISTKQTAKVLSVSGTLGTIKDVSPDGSVIYERVTGCNAPVTTWSVRTDGTGSMRIATAADAVRSASPSGSWLIAERFSAPRTMSCVGDSSERNVTFTIMSRNGSTLASPKLIASDVDWSRPALALG